MSLNLSLSFCQDTNCQYLKVTDNSNYDYATQVADITSATLTITPYGETSGTEIDVSTTLQTEKDGTVSITTGSRTVTGSGTSFTTDYEADDGIIIDGVDYVIHTVYSDTSLLLKELALTTASGATAYLIDKEFALQADSLGGTAGVAVSDGVYRFQYEVVAGGVTYTYDARQLLYCQAECCVTSRLQEIGEKMLISECDDNVWKDTMKAYTLLKALQSGAQCGSYTELNTILTKIQRYCSYNDDGCSSC